MWPFRKQAPQPELRQSVYVDAVIESILSRNSADPAPRAATTAALEIAAGVVGRAFASAMIDGAGMLEPSMLNGMARRMISGGETVWYFDGVTFVPAPRYETVGSYRPETWEYRIEIDSPSGRMFQARVPRSGMIHAMYSFNDEQPWIGVGPLQRAIESGQLAANIERSLSQETSGSVGYLLPIPADGTDESIASFKADLKNLNGKTSVVETTAGGWGEGRIAAPRQDYVPQRIGPNPPPSMPAVHAAIQNAVLASCGVPIELVVAADGTGQREAWRRFMHGTLQPLSLILATELTRALGRGVTLTFDRLFASDIAGRARAFQSMVGSGMDLQQASALSGLMVDADRA